MADDIIEYLWDCPSCSTRGILGRHVDCPTCGASVPGGDPYYPPANEATVAAITDPDQLRDAQAAPNWSCSFCGGTVRATSGRCIRCGGGQAAPGVRGPRAPSAASEPPADRSTWLAAGGLCALLLLFVGLIGALFVTHTEPGVVVDRAWLRAAQPIVWQAKTDSAWCGDLRAQPHQDPPGEQAGVEDIRNRRSEVHHYDRIRTGSHEVCTTSAVEATDPLGPWWLDPLVPTAEAGSHGNGYGSRSTHVSTPSHSVHVPTTHCHTVTDYTRVPRYADKCDYTTWAWKDVGAVVTASGHFNTPPQDPLPPPGFLRDAQHQLRISGTYTIEFAWGSSEAHRYTLATDNLSDWARWTPGTPAALVVNLYGRAVAAAPELTRAADDVHRLAAGPAGLLSP